MPLQRRFNWHFFRTSFIPLLQTPSNAPDPEVQINLTELAPENIYFWGISPKGRSVRPIKSSPRTRSIHSRGLARRLILGATWKTRSQDRGDDPPRIEFSQAPRKILSQCEDEKGISISRGGTFPPQGPDLIPMFPRGSLSPYPPTGYRRVG